jgi:PAS domain S-box-containing protein
MTHSAPPREQLDLFFTLSLDLLCIVRTDGYFQRVNPAFTRALGYTDEELCSRPYVDFVHAEDQEATRVQTALIASGIKTLWFDNRFICKDGTWKWLGWSASASTFMDGLAYAVARDITSQKAAEAVRAALIRRLEDSLEQVKTLEGLLPICSYCKRIRDESGAWDRVESYIAKHSHAVFTHGICPACMEQNFPLGDPEAPLPVRSAS